MGLTQLVLGAVLVMLVESSCKAKRPFYPFHNQTYTGPMLYKFTKATQTVEQCQRMCNQVLKCTGFVMRWAGPQRGYCDFFNNGTSALEVGDKGTTVFLDNKCPAGFKTYSPSSHCYSVVTGSFTYLAAQAHCANLQGAYLVEIQTREENNAIRQMVLEQFPNNEINKIRLGAKREQQDILSPPDRTAFKWEKSGACLCSSSTNKFWKTGNPNYDALDTEMCLLGNLQVSTNEMNWSESTCDSSTSPLVCELEI